MKTGRYEADSLYVLDPAQRQSAVLHLDPETDLLAHIDGFYLVAPGWKRCRECGHLDSELKLADVLPAIGIGERIRFSKSGGGVAYLAAGWFEPEGWGTWSSGRAAEIIFRTSGDGVHGILIEADALVSPAHPKQDIEISVNGIAATTVRLTAYAANRIRVPIPEAARGALRKYGALRLEFRFPDTVRPRDIGLNNDRRALALGLLAITLIIRRFPPMDINFLEFERPIAELVAKIEELRHVGDDNALNIGEEIERLERKSQDLTESIFAKLTSWQISQLSRHPQRPYLMDYLERIFDDFQELHGDRAFADDHAIVGGLGRLAGRAVMIVGHQKGRDTKSKLYRNFGMPRPEGYRKALRLMTMAERFRLPLLTFIDTPGAYPGVGAEERGQSEAIARNLQVMAYLRTPILCTVIGEGGSGGALAIGVGDRILMLQYSTYSVISPEGCASILWKNADKAQLAAEAMAITSDKLKELGLIDAVVPEPRGGAHRDPDTAAANIKQTLISYLDEIRDQDLDQLLTQRYERMLSYGRYEER